MNIFAMLFDLFPNKPESLLILIIIPFLFFHISLRTAIVSIYELGKSKSFLKKEKRQISFLSKLSLYGFAARCKRQKKLACRFYCLNLIYTLITLLCMVLWVLSLFKFSFKQITIFFMLTKAFMFEVPYVVYFFINTKRDMRRGRGGVIWRWEDE